MRVWTAAFAAALLSICLFAASAAAQEDAICAGDGCGPPVECESDCGPPVECEGVCPGPIVVCGEVPRHSKIAVAPAPVCAPPPICSAPLGETTAPNGSTLNGKVFSFTGDIRWFFEYGAVSGLYTGKTPLSDLPPGVGTFPVSATIGGGATYYRLVVVGCNTIFYGQEFKTSGAEEAAVPAAAASSAPAGDPGPSAGSDQAVTASELAVAEQATAAAQRSTPAASAKKAKKARKHRRHHR